MIIAVAHPMDFKAASLFFDRVWSPRAFPGIKGYSDLAIHDRYEVPSLAPEDFAARDDTLDMEALYPFREEISRIIHYEFRDAGYCTDSPIWEEILPFILPFVRRAYRKKNIQVVRFAMDVDPFITAFWSIMQLSFIDRQIINPPVPPAGESDQESFSSPGALRAVEALLDNGFVVERNQIENVNWDLLRAVRSDPQAARAMRELRLLIYELTTIEDPARLEDIIQAKMEAFVAASKKHGISVVAGCLKDVLSWDALATMGIGAGLANLFGGPLSAAITAGTLTIGRFSLKLAEILIDAEEVKEKQGLHIAYMQNAKKVLNKT